MKLLKPIGLFCCVGVGVLSLSGLSTAANKVTSAISINNTENSIDSVGQRKAAISWIRDNAIELQSMEAGSGYKDMASIGPMIGDAKVIGLGEATHGTREFFQLKHRMFEYLVENHGFRLFGIEANYADCLPITNYVLTGEGDPEALINGMNFWTWDTEEVLDLVLWMRAYNESHEEKLTFFGYDAQYAPPALKVALDYLEPIDPEKQAYFKSALTFYLPSGRPYEEYAMEIYNESPDQKLKRHTIAQELLSHLDKNKNYFIKSTGQESYSYARAAAFSAERAFAMYRPVEGENAADFALRTFNVRDRAMADLVHWGLEHYGPDQKAVLWAHNGHIQKAGFDWANGAAHVMGMNLAEDLGSKYISLGFGFNQGGFQARGMGSETDYTKDIRPLRKFVVGPAPVGTLDGTMHAAQSGDYLIDMRTLPKQDDASEWFSSLHAMRIAGGIFADVPADQWGKVALSETFDLFVFIDKTTRARPLERTRQRFRLEKTW